MHFLEVSIHIVDLFVFIVYLITMLAIGFYYYGKSKSKEDYFVGGRQMSAGHVGLSVVATDVGGGFSIGLGGLGFVMGLSGSWMLFTGLIGAWLSVVFLIPKIYPIAKKHNFLSFPQVLGYYYNEKVAFVAGIISLLGYVGFTSSQILAGAKLASATFGSIDEFDAVLLMGTIAVIYTVVGGIKAVIYTDTIQWIILMVGLIFIGIPLGYMKIGGLDAITQSLPPSFFSLANLKFIDFFNWVITIVPIWFVGMTIYQRLFSCKDEKSARKAWIIAGVFEYPIMAFMGVLLGLFAKVAFDQNMFASLGFGNEMLIDAELGLPLLLRSVLPLGLMGIVMSAYFSAIMSTADSCLMAASGNFTTDIAQYFKKTISVKASRLVTLFIGVLAIVLASFMQSVLSLMLYSYSFMVSGLFVPVVAGLILKRPSKRGALFSMLCGGIITLLLILMDVALPLGLDANFFGLLSAFLVYSITYKLERI